MEQSTEAKWLINNWNRETLSRYRNQWIAVSGEKIIAHAETFPAISDFVSALERNNEITNPAGPLFAFVHLGRLQ